MISAPPLFPVRSTLGWSDAFRSFDLHFYGHLFVVLLLFFFLELSRTNLSFILFRFRKVVWDVSAR